jgi:hypothetical protein
MQEMVSGAESSDMLRKRENFAMKNYTEILKYISGAKNV